MAEEFEYDPEAEQSSKATRLPYGLCKAHGIKVEDWWTPRDAWNALKSGGFVDDVNDAYKEYFRKKKKEQQKLRNKKSRERAKLKKAQLSNPIHNPDPNYQHKPGHIAGAAKGAPMTFEQADSGNVNPYVKDGIGYRHNCQTCVAVYLARRQGYDVRALPNLNNKNIYRLSVDTSLAYVDKNGGQPMHVRKPKYQRVMDWLGTSMKDGGIYAIEFGWKGSQDGHIITAEKVNGKVRLYDPQMNKVIEDSTGYFARTRSISMMDLSGCKLNESFCDSIMKKEK